MPKKFGRQHAVGTSETDMTQPVGLCEHALHFTRPHRLWGRPHSVHHLGRRCL